MAELAKDAGMPAVAITDTGNLFGALEFSDALAEKGIQPIIGCTLKVDLAEHEGGRPQARRWPSPHPLARCSWPRTRTGYRNLMKLSSRAYLSTPDNAEHHMPPGTICASTVGGLICLTGGPAGPDQRSAGGGSGAACRRAA